MRLAVDTNAYTEAARGRVRDVGILRRATEIFLPFAVLGELRGGFAAGNRGARNEAALTAFLQSPRVRVLDADEQTTSLDARLRRRGVRLNRSPTCPDGIEQPRQRCAGRSSREG